MEQGRSTAGTASYQPAIGRPRKRSGLSVIDYWDEANNNPRIFSQFISVVR
jgi:hypothetical protein